MITLNILRKGSGIWAKPLKVRTLEHGEALMDAFYEQQRSGIQRLELRQGKVLAGSMVHVMPGLWKIYEDRPNP